MKYDYVYYESLYTPDECNELRKVILNNIDVSVSDEPAENVEKTADVKLCRYGDVKFYLDKLHQYVVHSNNNFFGFNLFEVANSNFVFYNVYDEIKKGRYDWHRDGVSNQCFDHKLTVLLNLSKDTYSGGKLELFLSGGIIEMTAFNTPGTVCIFPSWVVHRVTPVIQGQRISAAMFYSGPNIK
jgi:PKHD-type hydroxylase